MNSNETEPSTAIDVDPLHHTNYECNICFVEANNPVVTECGHLYCWPCIYHWLNTNRSHLTCPVCKSGISEEMLIPLFTRGNQNNNREQNQEGNPSVPPRPRGVRREAVENVNLIGNSMGGGTQFSFNSMFNVHNNVSLAGYGYFPPLFYQAVMNKGDPEINPVDGMRIIPSPEINDFKLFMKIIFVIFIFVFLVV